MSLKHTPGPWTVGGPDNSDVLGCRPGKSYTYPVAQCTGYKEEREANARLIAEAPAMLEALREAARALAFVRGCGLCVDCEKMAYTAILKSEAIMARLESEVIL